jgi:ArsR family metal-binding transcriptional regulator
VYYTFRLCRSGGFEVMPKGSVRLNLLEFAGKFEKVMVKTDVILVVKIDEVKASIYPSGRILLHNCSEDRAQEIAMRLYMMVKSAVKK